jgi:hypothetical protein
MNQKEYEPKLASLSLLRDIGVLCLSLLGSALVVVLVKGFLRHYYSSILLPVAQHCVNLIVRHVSSQLYYNPDIVDCFLSSDKSDYICPRRFGLEYSSSDNVHTNHKIDNLFKIHTRRL